MLPLNDEWLCWPPESLDSFFAAAQGAENHEVINQPEQEKDHEDIQISFII